MKARTNIKLKTRRVLKLDDFKGVDFSSSPYDVKTTRATKMRNLINEYGVNRKRPGWREIKTLGGRVNGIFEYRHEEHSVILVHAGEQMYRINYENGITNDLTDAENITGTLALTDTKSQAFYSKGSLYIIGCGDYLIYGKKSDGAYCLRSVYGDEGTYIPTTMTSIDPDGTGNDDLVREVLDSVNLLTPRRKNLLLGTESENASWTLDSGYIDEGSAVVLLLERLNEDAKSTVIDSITNSGTDKTRLFLKGTEVGSVDFAKGVITLNISTTPPIENFENITAEFSVTVEGYSDVIKKTTFGVLFGTDGSTDRLFVSGNPDYPNADFYSESDDYSYFPDENSCTVGSDASAINGYVRLADSTLAVFKEEYTNEPNIFYRTGYTETEYDESGIVSAMYGIFPTVAGTIGEALISRHAVANLGGDCLMLSRNGVYGVVLGENARTTERYTRERSRSINERLKDNMLEEACGIVHKNKYYLSVDGVCYVADARFTYRTSDALDGTYNYEWWYWDNIPARIFAVIGNELYFGTPDGLLCVFDKQYSDRTYVMSDDGELIHSSDTGRITYSNDFTVSENDKITFLTDNIYAIYDENVKLAESGKIKLAESLSERIYDGIEVYADNVEERGLNTNVKYTITNVDRGALTYSLADESGNTIEILKGGFNLYKKLAGKELYIEDVREDYESGGTFAVKEFRDDEKLVISPYNGELSEALSAVLTRRSPVVAEWYSPILDMGTNESSKTLLKLTVSTEPEINGNISFGYETRSVSNLIGAKGINIFSFDNLSFENFSFETGFASSYSVRLNVRNFNYIIFRFVSDSDTDCAVNDFTVTYKINKANRGVR